jgi:uncharacterized membrane protein
VVAGSQTTITFPDGSAIALADWVDDSMLGAFEVDSSPPWDDPCSEAGWLVDLVLALPDLTRCERRAARHILRQAKQRGVGVTKAEIRRSAQAVQATAAIEPPDWRRRQVSDVLQTALNLLKFATGVRKRTRQTSPYGYGLRHDAHEAGVDVVRIEVRWRIRDWVGRVPVPPHVRQAAYVAWMVRRYEFTRKLVEDYVNDWLKEK